MDAKDEIGLMFQKDTVDSPGNTARQLVLPVRAGLAFQSPAGGATERACAGAA
jgi:hypothetical protein